MINIQKFNLEVEKIKTQDFSATDERDVDKAIIIQGVLNENRYFLLELILHAADLSNPIRPFHIGKKWASKICEEFFAQGDLEESKGWDKSPMMDRKTTIINPMQMNFIDFVVSPFMAVMYEALPRVFSSSIDNLVENHKKWATLSIEDIKNNQDHPDPRTAIDGIERRMESLQEKYMQFEEDCI